MVPGPRRSRRASSPSRASPSAGCRRRPVSSSGSRCVRCENGRSVLVRRAADGDIVDVVPATANARTLVHEYGGGAYALHAAADGRVTAYLQRVRRPAAVSRGGRRGDEWRSRERAPPHHAGAAGSAQPALRRRARHGGRPHARVRARAPRRRASVVNELVALPTDGSGAPRVLAAGHDFYAAPRLSPDGRRLAWLSWDHPQMPWDGTELWVAGADGRRRARRGAARRRRPRRERAAAGVEPRRPAALRERPQRLVEPLPRREPARASASGARARPGHRARAAGRRVRQAPVGLRPAELRLPARRAHRGHVRSGRRRAPRPHRSRTPGHRADALRRSPRSRRWSWSATRSRSSAAALRGPPRSRSSTPGAASVREVRRSKTVDIDPGYISTPQPITFPTSYAAGSVVGPLAERCSRAATTAGGGRQGDAAPTARTPSTTRRRTRTSRRRRASGRRSSS